MIKTNSILSWKIIWKASMPSNPEAKMSIIPISYQSYTYKHKKKDPSLHNLTNSSIEKEQDQSKSILDSEHHSQNLIVFNLKQKLHLLTSEENTSVLIFNGKIIMKNMEITSRDCPILTVQFLKTLMRRVTHLILGWEKHRKT